MATKMNLIRFHSVVLFYVFVSKVSGLESENIVGGELATHGQFKYHVVITSIEGSNCGGSLLDDDIVLTAGHCVRDDFGKIKKDHYVVIAGVTNPLQDEGYEVNVAKIYVHTGYKERKDGSLLHDIAVMRLARSLNIKDSTKLATLALPEGYKLYDGKTATICGFGWHEIQVSLNNKTGKPEELGDTDYQLRYVDVKVLDNEDCMDMTYGVYATHICGQAIHPNSVQTLLNGGACNGDSGGTLVYNGTAIGILSNSAVGCDESIQPAVYTRVSAYMAFIASAMSDESSPFIEALDVEPSPPLPPSGIRALIIQMIWRIFGF